MSRFSRAVAKMNKKAPKGVKFDFFKSSDNEKMSSLKQRLLDTADIVKKKGIR